MNLGQHLPRVRLDVSKTMLVGREAELQTLKTAFHAIAQRPVELGDDQMAGDGKDFVIPITNCLLVSGESGRGKTRLVSAIRETVLSSGGSYARGKCDQHQYLRTQPCSVLRDALADLFHPCSLELNSDIQKEIQTQLDDCDFQILFQFVPSLKERLEVIHTTEKVATTFPNDQLGVRYDFIRVVSMVRKLFRAVTKFNPMVLFFDDLQRSDTASIDVVKSLVSDQRLPRFLFIGTYQTGYDAEDNRDTSHLDYTLTQLKTAAAATSFKTIELSEFSCTAVNQLVAAALKLDSSRTLPLSQVIYRKAAGNCFFVLQFLKLLEEKGLLYFSHGDYRWAWDLERIHTETEYASNVASLLERRFHLSLNADARIALAVAACFGRTFVGNDINVILETLLEQQDQEETDNGMEANSLWRFNIRDLKAHLGVDDFGSDTTKVLTDAVSEGLIDKVSNVDGDGQVSVYKFSHDKIQAAAYDLVKPADREMLHVQLAKLLYTKVLPCAMNHRNTVLVQIADLLESSKARVLLQSQPFRLGVARLNLEAARIVRLNGAFRTAAAYLRQSLILLGEAAWKTHYDLTLEISNLQAEMYFSSGEFPKCEETLADIFLNTTCIEDTVDAYVVFMDCLGSRKKTDEVLTTTYDVVSLLGFSAPKRMSSMWRVFHQFQKVKRTVNKLSDDEFVAYRKCDDRAVEVCLKLLSRTASVAWMADEKNNVAFIGLLMCNICLERGFNKYSANAFVLFAMILTKMGDFERGKRFGKLALDLSDRFKALECDGHTMLVYYSFIHHMSKPIHSLLSPLIEANQRGKAGGDVEHSHHACAVYMITYVCCGLPLMVIENDGHDFICEMKEYGQSAALTHARLYRQLALNLIHPSDDPFKMEGTEIVNMTAFLMNSNELDNKRTQQAVINCQLFLVCYLGRGREGQQIVLDHAKLKDHDYPACYATAFPYLRGMICFRLLRKCSKNRRRFWKRRATKEIRRVKTFVRHGFVNCCHQLMILEAELLAFHNSSTPDRSQIAAVKFAYDKSIAVSVRSGFLQDAGLASESASRYFRKQNDPSWSAFCLERAREHVQQWGALAKLQRMPQCEAQSQSGLSGDGTSTVSSAIHGRSRRHSFYRKNDHENKNWLLNSTDGSTLTRQNLSNDVTSQFRARFPVS